MNSSNPTHPNTLNSTCASKPNFWQETITNRLESIMSNIAQDFSVSKLSRSPARFSTDKLTWFNREYIKKLDLEEFCYRASKLKAESKPKNLNYRVGDYVYLVDMNTQQILINKSHSPSGQDGQFYCIGGGRDQGETGVEGLCREVREETNGKLILDPTKLEFIQQVNIQSAQKWSRDDIEYDGKEMNFWFYPIKVSELDGFVLNEEIDLDGDFNKHNWQFEWFNLSEVILSNDYLNCSIWSAFCRQYNKNYDYKSSNIIFKQQYLGWNLDKNRANLLTDFELESQCINHYQQPELELLKWKKITLEQSILNLKEILEVIQIISANLSVDQKSMFNSSINSLPQSFEQLSLEWETRLKAWIADNNKDAGSYFWPLRTALSGKTKSPSPFELLSILTIEQVENRINTLIS